MRLINADALTNSKLYAKDATYQQGWNDAIDAIMEYAPTVEPKEMHWCGVKMDEREEEMNSLLLSGKESKRMRLVDEEEMKCEIISPGYIVAYFALILPFWVMVFLEYFC